MAYKRVLTVQDISCVGQCSLTVALPVLSACGAETCVLPSAVLSTHTGGFSGVHFRDLSEDIPAIADHWRREGIDFDAVYTGYLGGIRQIESVSEALLPMTAPGGRIVVDPAMADGGKLYSGFDEAYVDAMRGLCARADVILPNLTEACMLTGTPFTEAYDGTWIQRLLEKLEALGAPDVVLTGVGFGPEQTGIALRSGGENRYYPQKKLPGSFHGTGDLFASAFVGASMQGKNLWEAARIAADFTALCIRNTLKEPAHRYGVKFEPVLGTLIGMLGLK